MNLPGIRGRIHRMSTKKLSCKFHSSIQLPLLSTINAIFPKKKITEHSIVLVKDLDVLQSISSIVSTTDAK